MSFSERESVRRMCAMFARLLRNECKHPVAMRKRSAYCLAEHPLGAFFCEGCWTLVGMTRHDAYPMRVARSGS